MDGEGSDGWFGSSDDEADDSDGWFEACGKEGADREEHISHLFGEDDNEERDVLGSSGDEEMKDATKPQTEEVDWEAVVDEELGCDEPGIFDDDYRPPSMKRPRVSAEDIATVKQYESMTLEEKVREKIATVNVSELLREVREDMQKIVQMQKRPAKYILAEEFVNGKIMQAYKTIIKVSPSLLNAAKHTKNRFDLVHADLVANGEQAIPPDLIFQSKALEDRLLVQAGIRPSPLQPSRTINSPMCVNKDKCKGACYPFIGLAENTFGKPLMSWMTEEDLDRHELEGFQPHATFPCLLCIRHMPTELVQCNQINRMRLSKNMRIQHFFNTVGEGEYRSEVCLYPDTSMFNGLYAPVVYNRFDMYRAYTDAAGIFRIDQSAMGYSVGKEDSGRTESSDISTIVSSAEMNKATLLLQEVPHKDPKKSLWKNSKTSVFI